MNPVGPSAHERRSFSMGYSAQIISGFSEILPQRMKSTSRLQELPDAWRFALVGGAASLPATAILHVLPNSEATIGGSVMIIGGFIAGSVAATRSGDPDAAGFRAGLLGGVLAVLTLIVTVVPTAVSGPTTDWPPSRVVFWVFASGLVLCVSPAFGLGCGRVGGWVATTVTSVRKTNTNAS